MFSGCFYLLGSLCCQRKNKWSFSFSSLNKQTRRLKHFLVFLFCFCPYFPSLCDFHGGEDLRRKIFYGMGACASAPQGCVGGGRLSSSRKKQSRKRRRDGLRRRVSSRLSKGSLDNPDTPGFPDRSFANPTVQGSFLSLFSLHFLVNAFSFFLAFWIIVCSLRFVIGWNSSILFLFCWSTYANFFMLLGGWSLSSGKCSRRS